MFGAERLLVTIPALGSTLCIGMLILVILIILIAYFFSLLIEFLPATLIAILVYIFTGSFLWAIISFIVIALLMTMRRKRRW
ncbi:MAG: hypothetical protein ACOC85_02665 [Thermoplasmatota archaeon]